MATEGDPLADENIEGHWWIHGEDDPAKVPGTLTIDHSGRLTLSLIGALSVRSNNEARLGLLQGESLSGEHLTLIGASVAKSQSWGSGLMTPQKHIIRADRVLRAIHLDNSEEAVFTSARVLVENLAVWTNLTSYSPEGETEDPIARVPTSATVEFDHDGMVHQLRHRVSDHFEFDLTRRGVDITCPTTVLLEIRARTPVALNAFDAAIYSWVDLLTFVTGEACALISVHLVHTHPLIDRVPVPTLQEDGTTTLTREERERERRIEMRARWSSSPRVAPETKANHFDFVLRRGDRSPEDWYRSWMSFRERAKSGLDMLLSLTYGSNAFLQSDLLIVAIGSETMHRGMFPDCLAMLPKDFDPIINTAVEGLEPQDAERIRRSIRNEPSYPDRLRDLADIPSQEAVQIAIPDIAQWVKDLTAARNGLAHGLRKTTMDIQRMYDVMKRTRVLLELVVMAEIGVSAEQQRDHAIEHQT